MQVVDDCHLQTPFPSLLKTPQFSANKWRSLLPPNSPRNSNPRDETPISPKTIRFPTMTQRNKYHPTTKPKEVGHNLLSIDHHPFHLSTYSVCWTSTHSDPDQQINRQGQERGPKTPLPQQQQLLLLRRTWTLLTGLSQAKVPVVQQYWTFPARLLETSSSLRRRTTQQILRHR